MKKLVMVLALLVSSATMAKYCATVYQGTNFSGESMTLHDGESHKDLGDVMMDYDYYQSWDNKVSSIAVAAECKLIAYQYQNFGREWGTDRRIGDRRVYRNNNFRTAYVEQLFSFDNVISSVKCLCK